MARRPEFYFDEKTGYYRKRVKLPNGKWKDVRGKTKEEVRRKLYDLETSIRQGLVLDDDTTVAELAAEWYSNRKAGLSFSRQGDYRTAINLRICPVIGGMKVKDVKPEHCQRVMAQAAELSFSAQQKTVSTMKQIFACAVDNGLILRSPAEKIKAGGKKPEEKTALTREQCAQLEAAVQGTRAYIFVMLGLYAGLRREEICGLQWKDIDLEAVPPRLTVRNAVRFADSKAVFPSPLKSKAAHRTIPLPPNLVHALQEAAKEHKSPFVVPSADGQHITYQGMRNLVRIIDRRAPMTEGKQKSRAAKEQALGRPIAPRKTQKNIQKIDFRPTPHLLRHTYITRLIETGVDIKRVQYLAGHDDIRMTLNVYAHVAANRPEDLIEPVLAAFSGQNRGQTI
ncbi:MAG: tyrosine-type recombinase/integrase [Oscillibacter sp.]|jgi:integrase|nr:tyrosine-type recombinase/integrase [Oscillibacter sp.]